MTTTAYWRPTTLAEALELLERPGAVVLAGGTQLNGRRTPEPLEVVDLQAVGLKTVELGPSSARVGAMTTLEALVESSLPDVVPDAARREQPSTLRSQSTIGGCIATGDGESELLAALLVHEAVVHLRTAAAGRDLPLEELLATLPLDPGRVLTAVTIRTDGRSTAVRTARTPADRAIVAAVGRTTDRGRWVALSGVAETPVIVQRGDRLHPVGDHRGSSEYRQALARTLLGRIEEAIA